MTTPTALPDYEPGSVRSADGTVIGYRRLGSGPGLIAVHGGMQAGQNFMWLAAALADAFTVYLPDRRGRGLSGPPGDHYAMATECEDLAALLDETGAHDVFGLSSGALIALHAARRTPAITRVALFEPPLSIGGSVPMDWVHRFDQEVAEGRLAAAMVTAIRGTQTDPPDLRQVPREQLERYLQQAMDQAERAEARALQWPDAAPLAQIIPTMHFDAGLVEETKDDLTAFGDLAAEVLLLGGSESPAFLAATMDALEAVLPHSRRVELAGCDHVAADNLGDPARVAAELRLFFG